MPHTALVAHSPSLFNTAVRDRMRTEAGALARPAVPSTWSAPIGVAQQELCRLERAGVTVPRTPRSGLVAPDVPQPCTCHTTAPPPPVSGRPANVTSFTAASNKPGSGAPSRHAGCPSRVLAERTSGRRRPGCVAAIAGPSTRNLIEGTSVRVNSILTLPESSEPLRVALLAGTLGRGGAEKQLVYMARALQAAGVDVRVYTLGGDEYYACALRDAGLAPTGVGRAANPMLRIAALVRALWDFRPHIVQACHFYVNLYVTVASRLCGSLAIGAIRTDVSLDLQATGRWGPLLLRAPAALVVNSDTARDMAVRLGIPGAKIHVVPNVIETSAFDEARRLRRGSVDTGSDVVAVFVGQLVRVKRVERFLVALALARCTTPALRGVVVGAGPERTSLEVQARRLGLLPDGVEFRGACGDIPALLARADMLVLTSDHEGFPNVILEAMASGLPVVTTPAGDAGLIVQDGVTGFVVPFEAVETLVERLVRLALSPTLRHNLGEAGHERVKARYHCVGLADRLLAIYAAAAQQQGYRRLLQRIPSEVGTRHAAASSGS